MMLRRSSATFRTRKLPGGSLSGHSPPSSRPEHFNAEFEQGKGFTWAIVLKETNTCIGTCGYGFVEIGHQREMGFDMAKEYWGKWIMSESLKAVIDYGFSTLYLLKIEAHTFSENNRARHLLEKLGFKLDHVSEDSHYYFLTPKDF